MSTPSYGWPGATQPRKRSAPFVTSAVDFSSGDTITVPDGAAISFGDVSFCIAGWFRFSSHTDSVIFKKKSIFGGTGAGYALAIFNVGGNKLFFNVANGGTNGEVSTANLTADTWYYLVAGYDADIGIVYIRLNGVLTRTAFTDGCADEANDLVFGSSGLVMLLSDWAVFNRTLTDNEVLQLRRGVVSPADLSPVAGWHFNEGTGTTAVDYVGALDGTLSGVAWSGTVPPVLGSNYQPDGGWPGAIQPQDEEPAGDCRRRGSRWHCDVHGVKVSEVNNRKASGHFQTMGLYGEIEEGATLSCVHCQHTWILQRGSGKQRGYCFDCMGFICGPKCAECIPLEVRLENIEAGRPELTPRPVKVFVPPELT